MLQQLMADRPEAVLTWNMEELAAAIVSCTGGHRGLTGVCLAQVDALITSNQPVSEEAWAERERLLPFLLGSGGIATYSALVLDLLRLQEMPAVASIMQHLLYNAGGHLACNVQ